MTKARPRTRVAGFTLLELILAMGLALLLFFLAIAGYTRLIESAEIDAAAQMLRDVLTEGRQDAISQNTTVEVRLYDVRSAPGTPTAYGTVQLHWVEADGSTPPALAALILPSSAVIDATIIHSSLVTTNTELPTTDAADPRIDTLTRAFHFFPNGTTDLAITVKWLLTVRAASQSNPAHFPANWACVEVDPLTGRTQIYRP